MDEYWTPPQLAKALMSELDTEYFNGTPQHILEPSSGGGAFITAAPQHRWWSCDISFAQPLNSEQHFAGDFLTDVPVQRGAVDWVVGNPPYSAALAFVKRSLLWSRTGVAMLLRADFAGSSERYHALFKTNPPTGVHFVVQRPSFIQPRSQSHMPGATGQYNYAMYVWNTTATPRLRWVSWR